MEVATRLLAELSTTAKVAAEDAKSFVRTHKPTTLALVFGVVLFGRVLWSTFGALGHGIYQAEGHHWRQAFTYGVAWNYAHNTLDFLRPRMFYELSKSNIVGMEAPIYPYLGGLLLRLSRDNPWPLRFISWTSLIAIVSVLLGWLGERRATSKDAWADRAGLLVALAVSPQVGVEFRSVQPDPLAAALAVLAAWFVARYATRERPRDLVTGAVLASLAVLTKPVALGVVPALVVLGTFGPGRFVRRGVLVSGAMALALVPHVLWDKWAQNLITTEMNGHIVISMQHDPKEMLAHLKNLGFVREALLHFLPNYSASWWLLPAVAAGIYRSLADARLRRFGVTMLVWLAVYMVELIAFGDRLRSNAYYFVMAPAAILLFAAYGLGALVTVLDSTLARPTSITVRAALITLVLPFGLYLWTPTKWASVVYADLALDRNRAVWTSDLGLGCLLLAVLIAFGIADALRPRRIPVWLGLPILAGIFCTAYPPWRDADQWFRFYDASVARRDWNPTVAAIRGAVNRHSKVSDRIVIDPPELVFFHQALRNGFGPAELNTPEGTARVKSRGTRLWLRLVPGGSPPKEGRLLESGPKWQLYCIAEDDCP